MWTVFAVFSIYISDKKEIVENLQLCRIESSLSGDFMGKKAIEQEMGCFSALIS